MHAILLMLPSQSRAKKVPFCGAAAVDEECLCLWNSWLCSKDCTDQGCSRPAGSMREWPSFSCRAVWPGQRSPVLSSESIASAPSGPPSFSQPPPSAGLGCLPCPAVWALSAAGSSPPCCQPNSSSLEIIALGTQKNTPQLSQRPFERLRHYKPAFFQLQAANLTKQSPPSSPAKCECCTGCRSLPEPSVK